jgi:hypothetical protein
MVFWWIAGRGADALIAARQNRLTPRIRWPEAIVGFLLLATGGMFVFGFVFFSGPARHDLTMQVIGTMALLWAFLGGLSVAAKIVQWRLRKRQSDTAVG